MSESDRAARSKAAAARRLRRELMAALNIRGRAAAPRFRNIVEALVKDAEGGNLTAIKEVLDRLVGKTNVGSDGELPQLQSVSWLENTPPSTIDPDRRS